MSKIRIHILGWVTLLLFPLPAFLVLHYFFNVDLESFLQVEKISTIPIAYGLEFGIIYAFFAIIVLKAPIFETIPLGVDKLVKDLKLNYFDAFFLSLCAGIGEELLFRAGLQTFLGAWATSFVFVAIHGYFSLKNPKKSLYGIVVFPFILLISFGYIHFGLWFGIAAHFSYDLVLFLAMISDKDD